MFGKRKEPEFTVTEADVAESIPSPVNPPDKANAVDNTVNPMGRPKAAFRSDVPLPGKPSVRRYDGRHESHRTDLDLRDKPLNMDYAGKHAGEPEDWPYE